MVTATEIDYASLNNSFRAARTAMKEPLRRRAEYLKQYGGKDYVAKDMQDAPLNMIRLDVGVKTRQLAPVKPRALCSVWSRSLKPLANDIELALNKVIKRIRLGDVLQKVVKEAMFGMGIVKVGLDAKSSVFNEDRDAIYGTPFVDCVSFSDFLFDPECSDIMENATWMCCRNRLSLDYVQNNQLFDKKVVEQVKADDPDEEETESDKIWVDGNRNKGDVYGKWVTTYYFWFPYEKKVAMFATKNSGRETELMSEPLFEADWKGPCGGPFRVLVFDDMPGNPLPIPPISQIYSLHMSMNRAMHKLIRMAKNKKTIHGVMNGQEPDLTAIRKATDGEAVNLANAVQIEKLEIGGVDQVMMAFGLQLKQLISYMAGNLDLQGGLTSMSDTLGQDRMLGASASKQIDDMQRKVMDLTSGIMQDLGFYLWSNPLLEEQITKTLEGTDFYVNRLLTPEDLEGEWDEFDIEIEPYSAVNQTPSSQLQMWSTIFQNFILPNFQMMQQQGISIDIATLLKKIGKYANIPDLTEIVMFQGPMGDQPTHVRGTSKPQTHSVYERRNTSRKSPEASEQEQIQSMMAGAKGGNDG